MYLVYMLMGGAVPAEFSSMLLLKAKKAQPHMADIGTRVKKFIASFNAESDPQKERKRERSVTPIYNMTPEKLRSFHHPKARALSTWQMARQENV